MKGRTYLDSHRQFMIRTKTSMKQSMMWREMSMALKMSKITKISKSLGLLPCRLEQD